MPEEEYRFHPDRKWRFDFAWPAAKVALEIEGALWINGGHSRGSGRKKDQEKFNNAASLGWLILYATPQNCYSTQVLSLVKKAYQTRVTQ